MWIHGLALQALNPHDFWQLRAITISWGYVIWVITQGCLYGLRSGEGWCYWQKYTKDGTSGWREIAERFLLWDDPVLSSPVCCAGLLSSLCAYCLPKLADKTAAPFAVMCLFSSFLQPPEKPFSKPWGYVLLSEEAGLPYFCKPYIESGLLKDVSCSQLSTQDWSRKGWLCWGSSISEGRGTYSCVRSKKRNIITFWWSHVPI